MPTTIIVILVVLVVVVLAVVGWVISAHNRLVRHRNLVEESWNQIDVELNRRYDLVPNLVNTIKGATSFERSTLESVVGLRNQAAALAGAKADPAQRAQIEQQLTSQLQNLVSVTVEAYPALQSNANFGHLQAELSQIESRIANARKYYNANVGNYNTAIQTFPNSLIAGAGHFAKADYFQIQDPLVRANPVVDFSGQPTTPALPQQMAAPFAQPPATPGDYAQPDFTRQSGLADGR
jgi:LemA protein